MKKIYISNIPKDARYLIGFDSNKESETIQQRDIIETGTINDGMLIREFKFDSDIIVRVRHVDYIPIEIKLNEIKSDITYTLSMVEEVYMDKNKYK